MNRTLLCGCLPALLLLLASAQEEEPGKPAALQPVIPRAPADADPFEQLLEQGFKTERWRERLAESDLELRERSFQNLLRRARIEPAPRAFLEELARDASSPELAWTARLGLRELGRASFPLSYLLGTDLLDVNRDLEAILQESLANGTLPLPGSSPRLQVGPKTAFVTSREVELRQAPEGAQVIVRETVEGEERLRSFTGEDLASLLGAEPELGRGLGLSLERATGVFHLRLGLPDLYRAPLLAPGEYAKDSATPWVRSRPLRTDVLGVHVVPIDPRHSRQLSLPEGVGLYVQKTEEGTLAHILGLTAGHVLIQVNGVAMVSPESISERMAHRAPEDPLTLTFVDELGLRQTRRWPQD